MATPLRIEKMEDGALKTTLLELSDQHGLFFYFRKKNSKEISHSITKKLFVKLGGMDAVANYLSINRVSVWKFSKEDFIPAKHIKELRRIARTKKIDFPMAHIKKRHMDILHNKIMKGSK